jgi:hypothetical protein
MRVQASSNSTLLTPMTWRREGGGTTTAAMAIAGPIVVVLSWMVMIARPSMAVMLLFAIATLGSFAACVSVMRGGDGRLIAAALTMIGALALALTTSCPAPLPASEVLVATLPLASPPNAALVWTTPVGRPISCRPPTLAQTLR